MAIRLITHENIRCWYELSWQEKPAAIIFSIRKEVIAGLDFSLSEAPIVKSLAKEFKLSEFRADFGENIGFENADGKALFHNIGEENGFIRFSLPIPKLKKYIEKKCDWCKGSGRDPNFGNDKCPSCSGTGKKHEIDWKTAYAISASFNVLLSWLSFEETDTASPFPQLLTVNLTTQKGMHGGSLGGSISIPMEKWLASFVGASNDQYVSLPEISKAMRVAYEKMLGLQDRFERFQSWVRDGGFVADCPGDACGINPNHWDIGENRGYNFSCHNVDTPMQQITLLAGLAALHDKARREIKAY